MEQADHELNSQNLWAKTRLLSYMCSQVFATVTKYLNKIHYDIVLIVIFNCIIYL